MVPLAWSSPNWFRKDGNACKDPNEEESLRVSCENALTLRLRPAAPLTSRTSDPPSQTQGHRTISTASPASNLF